VKSKEERDAAARAAAEEAYREVYEVEHRDPLDKLFKFPEWVPGFFVALHRRCLRKLLRIHSRDTIKTEYANYKARLSSDHSAAVDAGAWYYPAVDPSLTDEFRDLAYILWALDICEADGPKAALCALLGDPDEAVYWQRGQKNVAAVKSGGAAKRDKYILENKVKAQKFKEMIFSYKNAKPAQTFTYACRHVAKLNKCSVSQVAKLLRTIGITAKTYKA
jgi:hypothetical protein